MNEIKVKVTKNGGRKYLMMYYECPLTGKRAQRSTKTTKRRDAEREAMRWETELRSGQYVSPSRMSWEQFRLRYEDEVMPLMADNTNGLTTTAMNALEKATNVKSRPLRELTAEKLSRFRAGLRDRELSEATVRAYTTHILSVLAWAVEWELIPVVPKVKTAKRTRRVKVSKKMKGRPIATEEFERMLASIEPVLFSPDKGKEKPEKPRKRKWTPPTPDPLVVAEVTASWRFLLEGLWWSGLRLTEALGLYWDRDDRLSVDLSGRRPMFRILAELEKSGQDRHLPMAPEFAQILEQVPEAERKGHIFKIVRTQNQYTGQVGMEWASATISEFGKKAQVAVGKRKKRDRETGETEEVPKWASAHDLRRSFGARWADRVMPKVLMELMRHEDINTTLKYYAGQNAQRTANAVWEAYESLPVRTFVTTSTDGVHAKSENAPTV